MYDCRSCASIVDDILLPFLCFIVPVITMSLYRNHIIILSTYYNSYFIVKYRMTKSLGLCRYKDIFGRPREGAHAYRIFDIAVVDVAATVVAAFLIAHFFGFVFWKSLVTLFIIGIISHRLFCVRTTVDKWVFPNV